LSATRITDTGDILPGDVVQSVDGAAVASMGDLIERLESYRIGDRVTLGVTRNGDERSVEVTLGGRYGTLD